MDFHVGFGRTKTFCLFIPTHSIPSFTYCTPCWVSYVTAKEGDVIIRQIHFWQLWDQGHQG